MLARRLVRCGITLSGGALAGVLSETAASAGVPALLLRSTVKAAVHIAAGQAAAVTTPAVALMNEVLGAMLVTKLKLAVAAVMVAVMLGAGGLVYKASGQSEGKQPDRPRTEVEALRHEVDLLKFNLEVVLEKCRAQEAELRTLRGQVASLKSIRHTQGIVAEVEKVYKAEADVRSAAAIALAQVELAKRVKAAELMRLEADDAARAVAADPAKEIEAALKAFREASDNEAKRRAAEKLEDALKKLRQQLQPKDKGQPQKNGY
jgi:hypothetical protein